VTSYFLRTTLIFIGALLVTSPSSYGQSGPQTEQKTNRVIMLGVIHSKHRTSERYSLNHLEQIIRQIKPDYVITEIPPDRLGDAMAGFVRDGKVSEARVARFPEYTDVLFPLTQDMEFKIIPAAAWTQNMADVRRQALEMLAQDPTRQADWQAYEAANHKLNKSLAGRDDDPLFIHSAEYDAIVKEGLQDYQNRFRDDLGRGDWTRINQAHYTLIEAALNNHAGEGATILITFGAGHKYWFLEQLVKRDDIELVNPTVYLTDGG